MTITVTPQRCIWRDAPVFITDQRRHERAYEDGYESVLIYRRVRMLLERKAREGIVYSIPKVVTEYDMLRRGTNVWVSWLQAPSPNPPTSYVIPHEAEVCI